MFKSLKFMLLAFSLSACMGTGEDFSALAPKSAMPTGGKSSVPASFSQFCARSPEECVLPVTSEALKSVKDALRQTQALVIPEEEQGTDHWQSRTDVGPGDCEDFALTMRRILRGQYPEYSAAFLIATAYTETNDYHAVLSIETADGTIVCDIRYPECAPWDSFPYKWRLREVAGADYWHELGPRINFPQTATAASGR